MNHDQFDAIVIGAGPGGSSCAALLGKKGLKTLLIEQNNKAGGKAMTVSKNGFRYELWPVTGGPMYDSRFEDILKEMGLTSEMVVPKHPTAMYYPDRTGRYQAFSGSLFGSPPAAGNQPEESPEIQMAKAIKWLGITEKDLEKIAIMAMEDAALTIPDIERLQNISYYDHIMKYDLPQSLVSLLGMQCNIIFVLPIDQIAASEFLKTSRDMAAKSAGYYSKGGYGRLFERCVEAFVKLGGEVSFSTRVEKIIVESGKVTGVQTSKGIFHAPIVVSNAGIQPTVLKLVGEEHFDKGYVNRVKDLVPSLGLMGTRYFLNRPFFKEGMNITFSDTTYWDAQRAQKAANGEVPDELLVFNVIPSNFDPELSPPGKQCVLSSTLCPADPDMKNNKAYWEKLDCMMDKIWPGFSDCIEYKENYSTKDVSNLLREKVLPGIGGECIGLGQVVGQCGDGKPSFAPPIRGLFYVGCDAGGYGCGTHQGVDSGFNVARQVELYYQTHSV
jgi:phytoene dehydrogenase-like protein